MRFFLAAALALPTAVMADEFTLSSKPTSVVVHPNLAMVTRDLTIDIPAGDHSVILPDLPAYASRLRIAVDGASLRGTRIVHNGLAPLDTPDGPELTAAEKNVEKAREALETLEDRIAQETLIIGASQSQVGFLEGLPQSQTLPSDPEGLRNVSTMVRDTVLEARRGSLEAQQRIRTLELEREDLQKALADAKAARDVFVLPKERTQAVLSLTAANASTIKLSVTYPAQASWRPAYDMRLTQGDDPSLTIQRAARVEQYSGEHWRDVTMELSTLALSEQTAPSHLEPPLMAYYDPITLKSYGSSTSAMKRAQQPRAMAAPALEASDSSAMATPSFDGPAVEYKIAGKVDVLNRREAVRLNMNTVDLSPRIFARAVPELDKTAYLIAQSKNTTQEPILASDEAMLYLDGTLVGMTWIDLIPTGEEFDLGFGPIVNLLLTHKVLDRSEGERGFIGKQNAEVLQYRMTIENRTQRDWDVELMGAVPYSEQDDLTIAWKADPMPTEKDVKDKRGLLRWDMTLSPNDKREITVEHDMRWPDGKELR